MLALTGIIAVVVVDMLLLRTRLLTRSKWLQRALNYSFAAVFASFAAIILSAQARHG